jgi:hypothetical protein
LYGAGGGGGSTGGTSGSAVSGAGAQGIVVLTWVSTGTIVGPIVGITGLASSEW